MSARNSNPARQLFPRLPPPSCQSIASIRGRPLKKRLKNSREYLISSRLNCLSNTVDCMICARDRLSSDSARSPQASCLPASGWALDFTVRFHTPLPSESITIMCLDIHLNALRHDYGRWCLFHIHSSHRGGVLFLRSNPRLAMNLRRRRSTLIAPVVLERSSTGAWITTGALF